VSRNVKTALLVASIAVTTFVGIILKYWLMGR